MIAPALLIVLALVAGTGAGVAYLAGGTGAVILGWVVGAILIVVACVVGLTYVVAFAHPRSVPPEHRAGPGTVLLAVAREFFAHVAVFTVLAPFERFWTRGGAEPGHPPAGVPVLLVHGYLVNAAAWWWFVRRLRQEGYRAYTVTIEPPLGSIDTMADSLARRIDEVCAFTGAARVHLVAHSMGGLVCRAYLRAHGPGRVGRLVTIASPHRGTAIARLGIGRCAREMRPGSEWLSALARDERDTAPPPTVALLSYYDNYIAPPESGKLPWARDQALPALGHVEMYFSRRVAARVSEALGPTAA